MLLQIIIEMFSISTYVTIYHIQILNILLIQLNQWFLTFLMLLPLKYFDVYQLPFSEKNSNYNSFQFKINTQKNKIIFLLQMHLMETLMLLFCY